jgi:hypothetical protein
MELWDAYNEKGEKLEGITLVRDKPKDSIQAIHNQ